MKKIIFAFIVLLSCSVLAALTITLSPEEASTGNPETPNLTPAPAGTVPIAVPVHGDYSIQPPAVCRNLQIFLITGKDTVKGKEYFSLSEALEKKWVKVNETGTVNELTIINYSEKWVYINSGDIVKGGRQDRTIGYDMLLPPKSGEIPLKSFCVESGRWRKRGNERADAFSANTTTLSTRKQKIAAKYESNQSEVWSGVSELQNKLNENVSAIKGEEVDVRSGESESSLQLTLENDDLKSIMNEY
ncbi:MAG: hypothetical protein KJ607_09820, partial [Bacteroidetes bacterium]|nr:hypothetical protein [Bacteroidota bacterium]